tara:strand:- start:98 stop:826 length:729 start_codon:yes stop_codon:yes gene_type:complete
MWDNIMDGVVIYKQVNSNNSKLLSLHYNEPDLDFISDEKLYLIRNPHNDTDDDMFWKSEQKIYSYCKENDLCHFTIVSDHRTKEKGSGKKCVIPGCKNKCNWIRNVPYGDKLSSPNKFLSICSYHRYKIISGRIGTNIHRDFYRFNMKGKCEISGFAFKDAYKLSKTTLQNIEGYMFENEPDKKTRILQKREAVKMAMKMFEVDHIDGNHCNNSLDNLQTLTKHAHVIKSSRSGDYNRWRKQ